VDAIASLLAALAGQVILNGHSPLLLIL